MANTRRVRIPDLPRRTCALAMLFGGAVLVERRGHRRSLRQRRRLSRPAQTRGQMAVFLAKTFGMVLYGP